MNWFVTKCERDQLKSVSRNLERYGYDIFSPYLIATRNNNKHFIRGNVEKDFYQLLFIAGNNYPSDKELRNSGAIHPMYYLKERAIITESEISILRLLFQKTVPLIVEKCTVKSDNAEFSYGPFLMNQEIDIEVDNVYKISIHRLGFCLLIIDPLKNLVNDIEQMIRSKSAENVIRIV